MHKRVFRYPTRNRPDIDREWAEELAFHLDARTAELEGAGLTRAEARREAERQYGDVDDAEQYCKELALQQERDRRLSYAWEVFVQDIRYALRQIRRAPGVATGTVAVLAVALTLSITCFAFVRVYLLRPLPVPNPERLVWVRPAVSRAQDAAFPRGLEELDWMAADSMFETTVAWNLDGFTVTGGAASEFVFGSWVSKGFTRAMVLRAELGRLFTDEDFRTGERVVLISDALWRARYGADPAIVGRTLEAFSVDRPDQRISATIIGVMSADMWHYNRFTDVLFPLTVPRTPTLAVLRPGDTKELAAARLTAWVKSQLAEVPAGWSMGISSAHDEFVMQLRPALRVAFAACLLMLLVVSVNVAGLLLTRTVVRRQELAVRSAIGAGRARIIGQVVTESLVLAATAGVLGVVLAWLLLASTGSSIESFIGSAAPGGIMTVFADAQTWLFAGGIVLAVALLVGAGPAVMAAGITMGEGLATMRWSTGGRRGSALRGVFVAAQMATCLALIAGSVTLARAALRLRSMDLGFASENVIKGQVLFPDQRYPDPAAIVQIATRTLDALTATPGVDQATISFPHPFRGSEPQSVRRVGTGEAESIRVTRTVVLGDYFGTLKIPLLQGRIIDERDRAQTEPVVVISHSLAQRLWPDASPLGQQLHVGAAADAPARTVIGVVGEVRETLIDQAYPDVYLPFVQSPIGGAAVLVRANDPAVVTPALKAAVSGIDRDIPLSVVENLSDVVDAETARHRFLGALTAMLAGFALVLAMIGLYATIAYDVAQRGREFAIRLAIGAQASANYRLVLGRGARLTLSGLLVGSMLAAFITRAVAAQVPAVHALGMMEQSLLIATLAGLAFVALIAPARRASRVSPSSLLRE